MKKSTKIKTWAFFMRLGNRCGCHQIEERSFKIKGWQFPVCARCTGILTGQIIGIIIYLCHKTIPIYIDIVITGNLAGIAQISILIKIIMLIVRIII